MKITNTKIIFIVIICLAVLACAFAVWKLHANAPATLANIPTPTGWYSWGETRLPLGGSTPTTVAVTFGNQPMDNHGNNSTTLIVVTARNASGKTEQQWIDTEVEPMLASLGSTTSTQSWDVMNGRRVLEAETMTPAGSYNLTNFLFDNGIEYSFNLAPSFLAPEYNAKNLASSSDAQVLRSMVQQFVQSFPSSVSQ